MSYTLWNGCTLVQNCESDYIVKFSYKCTK